MRAVNELSQIPFEFLIASPLTGAIKAQSLAARETVNFINEVGFIGANGAEANLITSGEGGGTSSVPSVRMVDFNYSKNKEDGSVSTIKLSAPLLSIVPIPYIRIDEMTIDFKAKLSDSIIDKKNTSTSMSASAEGSYGGFLSPVKVSFRASATKQSNSSRESNATREYAMDIHVRAVQDAMPSGLAKILGILEDTIRSLETGSRGGELPAPA